MKLPAVNNRSSHLGPYNRNTPRQGGASEIGACDLSESELPPPQGRAAIRAGKTEGQATGGQTQSHSRLGN